jgi:hypothetical protein
MKRSFEKTEKSVVIIFKTTTAGVKIKKFFSQSFLMCNEQNNFMTFKKEISVEVH